MLFLLLAYVATESVLNTSNQPTSHTLPPNSPPPGLCVAQLKYKVDVDIFSCSFHFAVSPHSHDKVLIGYSGTGLSQSLEGSLHYQPFTLPFTRLQRRETLLYQPLSDRAATN